MGEFTEPHHMRLAAHLAGVGVEGLVFTHQCHTCGLAARVELQAQRLGRAAEAIFQPDGEGVQADHHGPASL